MVYFEKILHTAQNSRVDTSELTIDTPEVALVGELWYVFLGYLGETDSIITGSTVQGFLSITRADSRFAPRQWETALLCNDVSHWLGANLKSAPHKPSRNSLCAREPDQCDLCTVALLMLLLTKHKLIYRWYYHCIIQDKFLKFWRDIYVRKITIGLSSAI